MKKAIFLDRDGVLNNVIVKNGRPYTPHKDKLFILVGVKEALDIFHELGYLTFIFTNQPDISKGLVTQKEVDEIHQMMKEKLSIDGIKFCPHIDEDNCDCRKPKPGMILQYAKEWDILLSKSYVVGDRWRDIEAGHNAGCHTILIGDGYQEKKIKAEEQFSDLLCFAQNLKKKGI